MRRALLPASALVLVVTACGVGPQTGAAGGVMSPLWGNSTGADVRFR